MVLGKDKSFLVVRAEEREFAASLVDLGIDEVEAEQLSRSCSRSWTVLGRILSRNAALRTPEWTRSAKGTVLSLLTLLACWDGDNPKDLGFVSRLMDREYGDIEAELQELLFVEDTPIMRIGSLWKVKSPLELLSICGPKLTGDLLARFFDIAFEALQQLEPVGSGDEQVFGLDLLKPDRQPYSARIRLSIANTLAMMGARLDVDRDPGQRTIQARIQSLISALMTQMDLQKWKSLGNLLPLLAEAGPGTFLTAMEKSLDVDSESPSSLIRATDRSACWHAGLLYALEILAWNPANLGRVVQILARLSEIPIQGNWGNSPQNSLNEILRSWSPQTSADVKAR
ncbi:MAG: hypothetical protein KDK23_17420, partial [Leptospiraceae bacterium]|nr:hypothetical protein [Leptospiraceae bacterium]